jgi:gliding motility-associated-like protein
MKNLLFALLLFAGFTGNAQNVNVQLRVTALHHGYDCGNDGAFGDQPDPRWRLWGGHSGGNYTAYTGAVVNCGAQTIERSGVACGAITNFTPFNICNYSNVNYTQVNAQMECWEEDACGGNCDYNTCFINDDDNHSSAGTFASINFRTLAPCSWNDQGVFYRDAADQYGARLEVYWEYVSLNAGTITGAQTICSGADPAPITSTDDGSVWMSYQWQYSSGGCAGPWTDIPGANSASYDPPVTVSTTCYRRRGSSCNAADVYTNTITITVEQPSSITSVAATPTSFCAPGLSDLSVTGTLGTGAQWQVYTGSCGGTLVTSTSSNPISVSPASTTTYFVRGSATSQCAATACFPVTVTVNTPSTAPSSISASSTTICNGTSVTLDQVGGSLGTGATYQWYSTSCGGTSVGSGTSISVSPTSTTTYFVRAESAGCGNTACAQITIYVEQPSSITSASAIPAALCGAGNTDISISGTLGTGAQWQIYTGSCGGTLLSSGSSSPVTVAAAATTTYYVLGSATTSGACPATSCEITTVTVNSASTAPTGVNASSTTTCAGTPVTLTQTGGVLGTGGSFEWYSGSCAGTSEGTGNSINVSPLSTTTYYVRAEDACGNTACASVTITVEQPSSITSASATPSTLCGPGNSDISISGTLGTGAQWEIYSGSCGGTLEASSGTSPITLAVPATTTYYVLGSASTSGACPATSCEIVVVDVNTVSTAPSSISATSTTICVGQSTQLTQVGGVLGSGGTFEWYTGSCGGAPVGSGASINVSPVVNTDYFVRAEDACGNTTCATITITVETPSTDPTSAVAATPTFCLGGNTNLTVAGGTIGTGAGYVWYQGGCGSGAPVGTGTTINVTPTATTTYFVRLEGSCNNTNCQTVTVTVDQPSTDPTAALASATNICPGQSSILTVTGGSLGTGANWEWYEGSCGGTPVGSGTSISVSPTSTTTYFVRAEGTCNNTNCAFVTITLGTGATAPTSADLTIDNICPGDTTEVFQLGGALGSSDVWVWYTGACGAVTVGVGETLAVAPTVTTTYFVRAVGTCGATLCQSVTVTVLPGSITPSGITASNNNFCEGGSTTLTVVGGSLVGGANWVWYENSCGGGTSIGSGSSITVTPSNTSTYFVRGEGGTCGNTECASIFINVLGTDAYFVFVDTICGLSAPFNLTGGLPAGGTYSGPGVAANAFDPSAAGIGTHTLTYSYTDGSGCVATATTDVTISNSTLAAAATVVPEECADGGVTIVVAASGGDGNYNYNWSNGASGNPLTYAAAGTYSVAVTDGSGCGTYVSNITVADDVDCVQLPNTFTPNGDGMNDLWNVDFTPYGGAKSVQIFSKWGQEVFSISNVMTLSWDGEWNGNQLPAGTYYYIVSLNDAAYGEQNGPITIVR